MNKKRDVKRFLGGVTLWLIKKRHQHLLGELGEQAHEAARLVGRGTGPRGDAPNESATR